MVRGLVRFEAPHERMGQQAVTLMDEVARHDQHVPVSSVDPEDVSVLQRFFDVRVVREDDQCCFLSGNKKNRKTKCLPALYTNLRVSFLAEFAPSVLTLSRGSSGCGPFT